MKTKKKKSLPLAKIVSIIVFSAVVLGILIYFWGKQTGMIGMKTSKLPITVQTINDQTQLYTIKAEYPVFGNALDQLNKAIEKDVTSRIDEFKKQSEENWEDLKKFRTSQDQTSEFPKSPFTFFLQWTPQQVNKNYISFVMNIEWFTGGANMAQDFVTFNWDVRKNKPLLLEDLFPKNNEYLKSVSGFTRENLLEQFRVNGTEETYLPKDMVEVGTAPTIENFSRFTFDDAVITFYFPKYQVAPGSFGPQKVTMERK
ncbi:MAG: hypothetical protein UV63_C0004G0024 [Microgenomates group bacterium GW2011_GWC1_43_11]|uniref:DUF3298 domain-containing protein n=1 Tax=Candidatus Gottesmanbacteria bacterium GW2011_GWB1_44_11c TaxID=1618447 RepID=A0A0G1IXW8_9BACT|nr:MAG: hypothetical protein UV63_C0004G0024 [Microgenomates group bacterium GW2011_GWC1_43_11]KKT36617.1 MAG: hypothetical protein UW22_C0036G0005 [Candidatus Gottesmanbacteria bacterium GW2011_GWB1_44_11c]